MTPTQPRLQRFSDADEAAVVVRNIGAPARVLADPPVVDLSPDPGDDSILAAAIAGEVGVIVSGDKTHMLALGKAEGIPIATLGEALERLGGAQRGALRRRLMLRPAKERGPCTWLCINHI